MPHGWLPGVRGLPSDRHQVGKGGGGELERGVAFVLSGEVEPSASSDEGIHEKRGDAGGAGLAAGGLAIETLRQSMLRIPGLAYCVNLGKLTIPRGRNGSRRRGWRLFGRWIPAGAGMTVVGVGMTVSWRAGMAWYIKPPSGASSRLGRVVKLLWQVSNSLIFSIHAGAGYGIAC